MLLVIGGCLGVGIASGSFDGLSAPLVYPLAAALFCFAVFVGFVDDPLTVPVRLQLMLYAIAALAGVAFAWTTSLIENKDVELFLFVVIAVGFKVAAAKLIKNRHAQQAME